MRLPTSETVIVKPELIRLVRRLDSKKWQAHYKLEKVKTWCCRRPKFDSLKSRVPIQN